MGLRARIVAALLATATLTLVVALVALLSPLDRRLRDDEVSTLRDASVAARPTVAEALRHHSPLLPAALALRRGTGAEVAIFEPSGRLAATTEPGDREPFGLARRALAGGRVMSAAGGDTASVALPVRAGRREVAVLAVKPLREARAAGSVVRGALLPAAAVGLFAAALIGAILAGRLASRVVRLRAAALRVAELGPIVEMPPDPGRDEIGDLSRAFVSMQQRLREQEQARRRFVSTASHELRTPLASLRLMLSLMREDLAAAPPDLGAVERQAARADRQAERLAALADDLLELSRIDAGVALRREPVDVGELCRDVIAEFESRADDEGVDVRLRSTSA